MSKNALVLDDHFGDDGYAPKGRILRDVSAKRFEQLEKKGLVREATAEEVEAGDQIDFQQDTSAALAPADDETADDTKEGGEKKKPEPENKKAPAAENKGA